MLDPVELAVEPAHVTRERVAESTFLERACTRLNNQPMGCLLDSAGPIMPRAERSFLSESIRGVFLEDDHGVTFKDFGCGEEYELSTAAFADWVAGFHQSGYGPGGPMLFPMLTYEAFNPFGRPFAPHPIWRAPRAIWLLADATSVYYRESQEWVCGAAARPLCPPYPQMEQPEPALGWRENEADYGAKIKLVQRDIYEGTYYQANLSQRFLTRSAQAPLETYQTLRALNPSPFMGVFRYGDLWVLSGSPERLVDKRGEHISARPIAGTKPRFKDPAADAASIEALVSSEKERAEHLMLVDLIRNDLGRVAAWGSVEVKDLYTVESYSHVHHLVTQVEARLREGIGLFELIGAMFPGGTITGAPKISCIQRLVELEGEARGPYTGGFGYVAADGTMDLNILIRTLIQHGELVCFHGGGGIVADSLEAAEYAETRQKCLALMEALGIKA